MRYATVLAGLVAAVSVVAQEDNGVTGSMTTLAIIETTQSIIVESTISSSADSLVATSTEILVVDTTTTEAPAVSGTQAASPAEVSRAACLDECDADDNDCRAECGKIANAVNPIADCQAGCFQGNGTDKDNKAYEGCMQECVRTATTSDAAASTSASSAGETTETAEVTATTTSGATDDAENTLSSAASGATAAASSAVPGAGNTVKATFSGAGILGVAAFMLAL